MLDEIRLAVQKGYELVEVQEVYEHQVTQCDSQIGNVCLLHNTSTPSSNSSPRLAHTLTGCSVPRMRTVTLATLD